MLIKQLYNPKFKINKINFFFRFISKLIIKFFFIDKISIFSNSFQQTLKTYIVKKYRGQNYFFKDGNERLLWRYKTQFNAESDLCNWIDTFKKKDIFYDIGSNVGMFTIYSAKKKILTYSFEPHPSNVEILYWNIFLNNLMNYVIVLPIALYSKKSLLNFELRDLTGGVAKNTLTENNVKKNLSFSTLSYDLDSLVDERALKKPTKVKLDVDGNEMRILKGMKKNLVNVKEIYIEMIVGKKKQKNYNEILSFLKKNNFKIYKKFNENYLFRKKK